MALRVEIPEGRREAFRDAMIRLLPFLTCDLCEGELDEHRWFEVRGAGTNNAKIVRCSGVEPDGVGHQEEGPMPADGKQNAAGLNKGNQILVVRDKNGKLQPSKGKTLALVATVEKKSRAGRWYTIQTDIGPIEEVNAIQTFWLATEKQKLKTDKPPVPPAQFTTPAPRKPIDVPSDKRCMHRSGCPEAAAVRVVGKPWQYCVRHGAEFELAQEIVVEGRFEVEPVR